MYSFGLSYVIHAEAVGGSGRISQMYARWL